MYVLSLGVNMFDDTAVLEVSFSQSPVFSPNPAPASVRTLAGFMDSDKYLEKRYITW